MARMPLAPSALQVAAEHVGRGAERGAVQQDRRHAAAFLEIADVEAVDRDEAIVGSDGDVHHRNSPRLTSGRYRRYRPAMLLPGHELQPAHAVRDIGLAVGDLLGLRAGRRSGR